MYPQQGEGDDLEDGVERDEDRGGLPVPAGEVVPDEDHRDAAGQADDEAGAVLRQVGQQQPREGEHERGSEDPVEQDRHREQGPVAGDVPELVVADLRQHRVHHHEQAHGDGQRHRADLDRGEGVVEPGDQAAEEQAGQHGHGDPQGEEPVERGESQEDPLRLGRRAPRPLVDHVAHASTSTRSEGTSPGPDAPAVNSPPRAVIASGRAL
jgi:hypothetical protein